MLSSLFIVGGLSLDKLLSEREKRATITKAEGEKIAATNLTAVADIMGKTPGVMKLRIL